MIPFTCPCCEVSQPPHRDGCSFHADATDDAANFDEVSALRAEIALLREERPIVTLPMPYEPWMYGPLSYRKWEVLAALKKAGVKWRKLPPGPEGQKTELPIG